MYSKYTWRYKWSCPCACRECTRGKHNIVPPTLNLVGWDSTVGIATCYGLEGLGIESRWGGGEIFRTYPDWLWGPPSLLYNGYWVFSGGKGGRGVTTTHRHLVPRSWKSRAVPLLPLLAHVACYRVKPYRTLPYLTLNLAIKLRWVVSFILAVLTLQKEPPVPTEHEARYS
jgi:hypothetical protein